MPATEGSSAHAAVRTGVSVLACMLMIAFYTSLTCAEACGDRWQLSSNEPHLENHRAADACVGSSCSISPRSGARA